jgi:DNA-directed RNA polymerase specialized sigma24 family protein
LLRVCIANELQKWRDDARFRVRLTSGLLDTHTASQCSNRDPAALLAAEAALEEYFTHSNAREREVVVLAILDGYHHREISEILEIPTRAVEGVIYRWRQKQQRRLKGGTNDA